MAQTVHRLKVQPWETTCGLPVEDPAKQYVTMLAESGFVDCPTCLAAQP